MTTDHASDSLKNVDMTGPCATLLADIGGTHLRFCLALERGVLTPPRIYEWQETPNLPDLIASFLAEEARGKTVLRAVLACAGPEPVGDDVFMLNVGKDRGGKGYTFSQKKLMATLGFNALKIVNDYRTIALSIPLLGAEYLMQIGGGAALSSAPLAVIGPGTGCNTAALLNHNGAPVVMVGESGHTVFAPVGDTEAAIARWLERQYPPYVWMERVVSGKGILEIYRALCALGGVSETVTSLAELREKAQTGSCALCVQALSIFCEMLGTATANTALTFGARGGVYISGGVVPRFLPFFQQSGFRARFESIGTQVGFLKDVPTFVITHPTASLLGAQRLASDLA